MSKTWTEKVAEFNNSAQIATPNRNFDAVNLQFNLVKEEHAELVKAMKKNNEIEILDAIGDSIYVLIGLALRLGYDIDGAFDEIHESNMSKVDGSSIINNGEITKIQKGPNYMPPDLTPYIGNSSSM